MLTIYLVFLGLASRFLLAADEVGHGVEVEDGELTGTPDAEDGPLVHLTVISHFTLHRVHLKFRPGVNATDFA